MELLQWEMVFKSLFWILKLRKAKIWTEFSHDLVLCPINILPFYVHKINSKKFKIYFCKILLVDFLPLLAGDNFVNYYFFLLFHCAFVYRGISTAEQSRLESE